MDSQAASEISHEIHGSYGPAFLKNIQLLGWDHPYFLVTLRIYFLRKTVGLHLKNLI
jgi:hypothetical protein